MKVKDFIESEYVTNEDTHFGYRRIVKRDIMVFMNNDDPMVNGEKLVSVGCFRKKKETWVLYFHDGNWKNVNLDDDISLKVFQNPKII